MATLYRVDGTILEVKPVSGRKFPLSDVQEIIGGYVQVIPFKVRKGGKTMYALCDEDGVYKDLPFNLNFHQNCAPGALVGDVLVVSRGEF